MIKNFKQDFNVLIIQKGVKIIKHFFPKTIKYALFYYFIEPRSFELKYFFYDNIKEQKSQTRTQFIKKKVKEFFDEIPELEVNNKQKILSELSRLRKAKRLTNIIYSLFDSAFSKGSNILKINTKNKNYCRFKNESDYIFNYREISLNSTKSYHNIELKDDICSINYAGDRESSIDII